MIIMTGIWGGCLMWVRLGLRVSRGRRSHRGGNGVVPALLKCVRLLIGWEGQLVGGVLWRPQRSIILVASSSEVQVTIIGQITALGKDIAAGQRCSTRDALGIHDVDDVGRASQARTDRRRLGAGQREAGLSGRLKQRGLTSWMRQ